jgi:hypothetical protein
VPSECTSATSPPHSQHRRAGHSSSCALRTHTCAYVSARVTRRGWNAAGLSRHENTCAAGVLRGMSVHCVLRYLLLDYMGWWAPVCCGMSVHCVLWYLLLDYMGWWAPVCCGMSVHCVL